MRNWPQAQAAQTIQYARPSSTCHQYCPSQLPLVIATAKTYGQGTAKPSRRKAKPTTVTNILISYHVSKPGLGKATAGGRQWLNRSFLTTLTRTFNPAAMNAMRMDECLERSVMALGSAAHVRRELRTHTHTHARAHTHTRTGANRSPQRGVG